MRTIILGLLGATMLSSVAQAACNDIPNPTRFNPQELSAYQECWLDEYKTDETAGILGSLAWVRLDGQYFSAPLSELRKMSGAYSDRFIEAIMPQLEEAHAEQQESIAVVVADLQEIARLKSEIKRLKAANAGLEDMIAEKEAEIDRLNAKIDTMYTQAELDTAKAAEYKRGYDIGVASVIPEDGITQDDVNEAATEARIEGYTAALSDYTAAYYSGNNNNTFTLTLADVSVAEWNMNFAGWIAGKTSAAYIEELKAHSKTKSKLSAKTKELNDLNDEIMAIRLKGGEVLGGLPTLDTIVFKLKNFSDDIKEIAQDLGVPTSNIYLEIERLQDIEDRVDGLTEMTEFTGTITAHDFTANAMSFNGGNDWLDIANAIPDAYLTELETLVGSALQNAYDSGYDEGYKVGYVEGYNKGISDAQGN